MRSRRIFWATIQSIAGLGPTSLRRSIQGGCSGVIDYIETSLGDEVRLDDLAAQACLSPYHFCRLFREATGLSPHRYVTDRRIQAARHDLARRISLVGNRLEFGFGSQATSRASSARLQTSLLGTIENYAAARSRQSR
ncbi:MAG: AraC family transcriptional regulator, partial [Bradyrhizobium sp.]|nr:AraC family transcriptional regulator [Bradyrhizobium sp.]